MPDNDSAESPPPVPSQASAAEPKTRRSNPAVVAVLLLLISGVGVVIWWETRPAPVELPSGKAFYTVDDGKTWFTDEVERIPPFQHDGKPAVRVQMFSCDGTKARFVGFLQKLPEDGLQKLKDEGKDVEKMDDDEIAARFGWLAKRPCDSRWINSKDDSDGYSRVIHVECPDGGQAVQILPKRGE